MFGYVKPFVPTLTVAQFSQYKAVYCGVCKALGRMGGQLLRSSLSYDFVFAALFFSCARGESIRTTTFRCAANPFKKRELLCDEQSADFAAAAAAVMMRAKLLDDIADGGFFASLPRRMALPLFSPAVRRAGVKYPQLPRIVTECYENQQRVEADPDVAIDMAADPSAAALGKILALCVQDDGQKQAAYDFGYMLGRWVYLIDAADDLEKDLRRGCFNPFAECRERIQSVLNLCVTEVSARFDKLPSQYHHPIMDNIVASGIAQVQLDTLNKRYGDGKGKSDG